MKNNENVIGQQAVWVATRIFGALGVAVICLIALWLALSLFFLNQQPSEALRDDWVSLTRTMLEEGKTNSVFLYSCENTDFILTSLAGMPEVERLDFYETIDLSYKGLEQLESFPNLRDISFYRESVGDMEFLANVKQLESLSVRSCALTDVALETIARITPLKSLIHSGDFSEQALNELQLSRPDLKIILREPN